MSTTINATLTSDGDGVTSLPVDPPLFTYADLRGLAEYASGVRKGVTVWLAAYGDGRIEEVPDGAPRPGALVVGTVVGEGRGNRDSVEYAWIGPFEDGKEAVDLLEIWHDGETTKSDSVFWTQSAVEKFLVPYYASVAGGHAVTKIEKLLGLLGSTVTVRAKGPSELAPMEGEVFALTHLPQSEYVARADTERWPNDKPLPIGQWTDVATLIDTGGTHHLWGWVYFGSEPGRFEYQIYHEKQSFGGNYAFFGWYDPNSTQSDSNPSPFPAGVATADKDGSYVLLRVPPR